MSVPPVLLAERYRLVRLIASGGMGVVWEGWDELLHRPVGVKLLRPQQGVPETEAEVAKNRAMREARITARLHHPNAVPVFDVVEHEGQPCLIMQFVPSTSLSEQVREGGPLLPREAARIGAQVASALAAAHRLGIVHRDVKPGNILIAADGTAMISDFGISHAAGDATLTSTGLVHGTPAYLAPEVARGAESDFASDVFSLGSTLYAAVEGAPPFGMDNNSIALLHRVASAGFSWPQRMGLLTPLVLEMLSSVPATRPSMKVAATRLAALYDRAESDAVEAPTTPMVVADRDAAPPGGPAVLAAGAAGLAAAATVPESVPDAVLEAAPASNPQPAAGPAPENRVDPGVDHEVDPDPEVDPEAEARPQPVPVPEPVAAPAAAYPTVPADDRPGQKKRGLLIGIAALLAVAVILGAVLFIGSLTRPQPDPRPAAIAPVAEPAPSATTPSSAPASSAPPPSPTPAVPSAPPAAIPAPAAPAPPPAPGGGAPSAAQLAEAISGYYALVPGNTDAAWPRMTANYQTNHAGGRQAFQQFWDAVARVSANAISGTSPDQAQATITYYFKDGRVVDEVTTYTLVDEGGTLKIAASTVMSSTTR